MKKYVAGLLLALNLFFLFSVSQAEEYQDAVVANPVITDQLNLHESPSSKSDTLGRFYSGTLVAVLSVEGEWAKVRMNRLEGYMLKEYLYMEQKGDIAPCYFYRASTVDEVSLKAEPSDKSDEIARISGTVNILGDIGDDWRYIRQGQYFGYVKTNQLDNYENSIYTAYIQPADGSSVARLYADRDLKKRVGLVYEGTSVTVLDMSRAGWAMVQIKNWDDTYQEETFYVHPGDVNPFILPWEVPKGQRTGMLLENYTLNHGGKQITLPEGALCSLVVNFGDQDWLVAYGPEGLLLRVPQAIIGYQDAAAGFEGPENRGYVLVTDPNPDIRPASGPDQRAIRPEGIPENRKIIEGWKTLEYLGRAQGEEQPWYQVRNYYSQGYLPEEQVIVLENAALYPQEQYASFLPGQHLFDHQSQGMYHFIAGAEEEATLLLKNNAWNMEQQFTISDAQYTIYIPEGTQAVLEGGGKLIPIREGDLQRLVTPENPRFSGNGRFFAPEELAASNWWDYRISPLDPKEESYYVISSLNTMTGQEIRVDLSDYSEDEWDEYVVWSLQPGCFLEVHNCLLELYWGNG